MRRHWFDGMRMKCVAYRHTVPICMACAAIRNDDRHVPVDSDSSSHRAWLDSCHQHMAMANSDSEPPGSQWNESINISVSVWSIHITYSPIQFTSTLKCNHSFIVVVYDDLIEIYSRGLRLTAPFISLRLDVSLSLFMWNAMTLDSLFFVSYRCGCRVILRLIVAFTYTIVYMEHKTQIWSHRIEWKQHSNISAWASPRTMQRRHVTVCALWVHCASENCPVRNESTMMMINCACENYGFVRCELVYNRINNMLYISFGAFVRPSSEACICVHRGCFQPAWLGCTLWRNGTARARAPDDDDDRETVCEGKCMEKNLSWIMTHVIVDYIANDFMRTNENNEKRIDGLTAWVLSAICAVITSNWCE